MLIGNKGEWSEIYVLSKLLSDQKLYPGDANFDKIENVFYKIIQIIRKGKRRIVGYSYTAEMITISIENNETNVKIPLNEFKKCAEIILREVRVNHQSFAIPEISAFLEKIYCSELKADAYSKSDIHIKLYDNQTNIESIRGFSIKSRLGGAPTLFNSSRSTNFRYKLSGAKLTDEIIMSINKLEGKAKIRNRIQQLKNLGIRIIFDSVENEIFESNLSLVDSCLSHILAFGLLKYFSEGTKYFPETTTSLNDENPLGYRMKNGHPFYEYKIKRFLLDVALGMISSKVWKGEYEATGGYIIVKESGDIVCYHIYDKQLFQDYLFNNAYFDTPSSSRHNFGNIYRLGDNHYINLNLQIRLK